ncbi:MAG: hypothetical protein CBB72_011605 [Muricauda sp. TMED12]|nr:MAG: hypothetical protein CBB72_011605 [Muricauda sp. TMED12]
MTLPASIDDLKASIAGRGGLARSNRFAIYVTHPNTKQSLLNTDVESLAGNAAASLLGGGSLSAKSFFNDPRDMFMLCESVTLPGRQIVTQEHLTSMKAIKKPTAFLNEDVSLTFNLTNDYFAWEYYKTWMDLVIEELGENHYGINFKSDYTTDMQIQQLGSNDFIPAKSITLKNCYPITLNSIELSNAADNAVTQCTVTLAYDNWQETGLIDGLKDLVNMGSSLI